MSAGSGKMRISINEKYLHTLVLMPISVTIHNQTYPTYPQQKTYKSFLHKNLKKLQIAI